MPPRTAPGPDGLTRVQREVWRVMIDHQRARRVAPSQREIGARLGVEGGAVRAALSSLVAAGLAVETAPPGSHRRFRALDPDAPADSCEWTMSGAELDAIRRAVRARLNSPDPSPAEAGRALALIAAEWLDARRGA